MRERVVYVSPKAESWDGDSSRTIEYACSGSLDGATLRRGTVRNRRNDLVRFGVKCHGLKGLFEGEEKLCQYGLLLGFVNVELGKC